MLGMENLRAYIREVLGVESWIRPQVESTLSTVSRPAFSMDRSDSWTTEESAFVEKILTATGLGEVSHGTEGAHVLLFDPSQRPHRQPGSNQTLWHLGPLHNLMHGTPQEVQQAKREVWNLLKQLKGELRT
jgi:hypothetical protein